MSPKNEKNASWFLPEKIGGELRKRILAGEYPPGTRLEGVRKLAENFSTSPVTILKALDILEAEKLIDRIPPKGVFVSPRLGEPKRHLKACFAFPETSIDAISRTVESYGITQELYQGMLAASPGARVDLQFTYFEDLVSDAELQRQLSVLRQFDFSIFAGYQLGELQKAASAGQLVFQLAQKTDDTGKIISVDYNRRDARDRLFALYRQSGCRNAAVISESRRERTDEFIGRVRDAGGKIAGDGYCFIDRAKPEEVHQKLVGLLSHDRPEFIFCNCTNATSNVYEAALELHLAVGKDFQMTGIANGSALTNLVPRYTFLKIPDFEMGRQIIEQGALAVRTGKPVKLPEFKVTLIEGSSINLK